MSTYDFEPNPEDYGPEPAHIANGIHKKTLLVAPPQREWVGLTGEELSDLYNQKAWDVNYGWEYERAIEAKLKEKNA